MGMFRITIVAVGNHGCQREKKGADELTGCGRPDCTDCITRWYITALKSKGASVQEATIHHWPGSSVRSDGASGDVVDNLVSDRRMGAF